MELQNANHKKVFSRLGISLFIITILVNVVQLVMANLINKFIPEFAENTWYVYSLLIVSFYFIGAPVFYFLVKDIPTGGTKEKKTLKWYEFICIFIMCAATMYIFNYVGIVINFLIGLLTGGTDLNPLSSTLEGIGVLPTALIAGIASPIVEELVFRKVLLDRLRKYGDVIAILVSGLCFGFYHGNIAQFLYASALGFIFAYVVIRTGKIGYSIALHICINMIGAVVAPQIVQFGMTATIILGLVVIGLIITGIILFILAFALKKLKFEKGEIRLEHPFKTVWLNAGMILYVLISLACFVLVILNS